MRLHIGGFWASALSFWHSYLDLASTPHPVPHLTTRSWLLQQDKPISICFKCFANQKPSKSCSCNSHRCHTRVSLALSPAPIGCVWICVDKFALAAPATLANFTATGKSFRSQDALNFCCLCFAFLRSVAADKTIDYAAMHAMFIHELCGDLQLRCRFRIEANVAKLGQVGDGY